MELEKTSAPGSWTVWNEVLIIGGGPSAKLIEKSRLISLLNVFIEVVAVNDAIFMQLPLLPVSFSIDNQWVTRNRNFLSKYQGKKYIALPLETWPECAGIPGVTYLKHGHGSGLSEDSEVIFGSNSGFGALNLAVHKGARRIMLLGFDMDPKDNDQYEYWANEFQSSVRQLNEKKIEVYNLSALTSITAFPILDPTRINR